MTEVGISEPYTIETIRKTKTKRNHQYETNPKRRKRLHEMLTNRLQILTDEYAIRIGELVNVITLNPSNTNVDVFGSNPLKSVVKEFSPLIIEDYHTAANSVLTQELSTDSNCSKILPKLLINGQKRTIDELTQANLRSFIPFMLKCATGRGKPGWGVPERKPEWWPDAAPWANVRCDKRTDEEKKEVPWTSALREIVKSCYRHFNEEEQLYDEIEMEPTITEPAPELKWQLIDENTTLQLPVSTNSDYVVDIGDFIKMDVD